MSQGKERWGLLVVTALATGAGPPRHTEAGKTLASSGRLQGALVSGKLLTCLSTDMGLEAVVASPREGRPVKQTFAAFQSDGIPRWHLGHGALWASTLYGMNGPLTEAVTRLDLPELLRGRAVPFPGADPEGPRASFADPSPAWYAQLPSGAHKGAFFVERDLLAAGPYGCRQFLLEYRAKRGRVIVPEAERWSFRVYSGKARWDKKDAYWAEAKWDRGEALPVAFKESFHAIGRGDDFYFLTKSDKLFHSPKPAKGKWSIREMAVGLPTVVEAIG
jgi:hypothetical protein